MPAVRCPPRRVRCAPPIARAQVTLQVGKDSKEAKRAAAKAAKPPPASGLDAFLAEIEKKKKARGRGGGRGGGEGSGGGGR